MPKVLFESVECQNWGRAVMVVLCLNLKNRADIELEAGDYLGSSSVERRTWNEASRRNVAGNSGHCHRKTRSTAEVIVLGSSVLRMLSVEIQLHFREG